MINQVVERIRELCLSVPLQLKKYPEAELVFKPSPKKWSKKELLGHLIDSATNNHHRFIRAQYETPTIYYDQDAWVNIQNYQQEDIEMLLKLWQAYNQHLAHVMEHIPPDKLQATSIGKDGKHYSLEFLITDYLGHLEHHLNDLLNRVPAK